MKIRAFILILMLVATLSGCSGSTTPAGNDDLTVELKEQVNVLISERDALAREASSLRQQVQQLQSGSLLGTALTVTELLKNKDMDGLASHIHPLKGVRFTPYSYVDLQADLVFTTQQITTLLQSSHIYTWGAFDGTGDPIDLTFSDYYDRFVYDADYANPHLIGNNVEIGTGNSINNIPQAYPNTTFTEFHFTGFDPQYAGMDWRSLRLVFENQNNTWYLVGIVHGEWTI